MSQDSEIEKTYSKVFIKWRIKQFFPLRKEMDYCITSPRFSLSDAKWDLMIYPNGDTEDDSVGSVSLYLFRHDSPSEKNCISFTIGIQKCDGSVFRSKSKVSEFRNFGYGEVQLLKTSELLSSEDIVSQDGSLMVFCSARDYSSQVMGIASDVETASQTTLSKSIEILQKNFKELLLSGRNTDVTMNVKGQEFQVHRSILAARSPVFSSMFDHDTEEKKSGVVNIVDLEPESFKDFLSFLYTGKTELISPNNVIDLYKAADKYDLSDLKNECVRSMEEDLCDESFYDVILLATVHNESKLLEIATDFFIKNYKTIFLISEWQSLMREHSALANELLIKMANKQGINDLVE